MGFRSSGEAPVDGGKPHRSARRKPGRSRQLLRHNGGMREAQVRAALAAKLEADHAGEAKTRVIHELDLCQSQARIDLAVVNGRLSGWEIKTRADRLTRLPRQEEVYSRIFDRVWLAADERHIEGALQLIPDWWGLAKISERDGRCRITKVRESKLNRGVDLASLVRLLWRIETLDELERLGLADGMKRAPRRVLWERLATAAPRYITRAQLQARVRERLLTREGWRAGARRTSDDGSS
jgi:hypothetical protein